jgi:hypothetical protein
VTFTIVEGEINCEDPDLWCDCGKRISSAYADASLEEESEE